MISCGLSLGLHFEPGAGSIRPARCLLDRVNGILEYIVYSGFAADAIALKW